MSFRAITMMHACVMCFWWEQTNMDKFKFHINTKILGSKQKKLQCNAKSIKHTILRRTANHRDGRSGHDVYNKRIIVARTSVAILHH